MGIKGEKTFPGFSFPEKNYYSFPKDLNGYMGQLTGNEFKVLAYIVRKTWGFNKIEDQISYRQFLKGLYSKDGVKVFDGIKMCEDTLKKCLNRLERGGFIEIDKKEGYASVYRLRYEEMPTPLKKSGGGGGKKLEGSPRKKPGDNNNVNNNVNNKNVETDVSTILPSFLDRLLTDKKRHIQIIGVWVKEKGIDLSNKDIYNSVIKRNLRPAKLLIGYKDEDIVETIKVVKRTDYIKKFTLETVLKFIDEVITGKKKQGPKIVRFEEIKDQKGYIKMKPIYDKQLLKN